MSFKICFKAPFSKSLFKILATLSLIVGLSGCLVFGFSSNVSAEGIPKPDDVCSVFGNQGCLNGTTDYATGDSKTIITKLAINVVNFLIFLSGAVAVFFIVLGGYKYVTDKGDGSQAKEGKSMVINALIGLVIIIASFTMVSVVSSFVTTVDIGDK